MNVQIEEDDEEEAMEEEEEDPPDERTDKELLREALRDAEVPMHRTCSCTESYARALCTTR